MSMRSLVFAFESGLSGGFDLPTLVKSYQEYLNDFAVLILG